jgi:fructose-bisphosphate aldolase class I
MDTRTLDETARSVLSGDRGLLAMDESTPTCDRRFAALGIPQTVEMRRAYRDMIVTTPGLGESIGGAILYDETIRQRTNAGVAFAAALQQAGIVPGIKVDAGSKPLAGFPDEQVTEGLDRLRDRLAEYAGMGARFAKWRAVIRIGDATPSHGGLLANAHALARYAALCQEAGLVPIVEPEVLMDGDHTLQRCREVTEKTLDVVFAQLRAQRVRLEGMLLKPNMVLPGEDCAEQSDTPSIAAATVETLLRCVPAAVPGVAFLSGGQTPQLASERLNAMNATYAARLPWPLTFSFARAIQQPAMEAWRGDPANVAAAQHALAHRAACNRAARRGRYDAARDAPAAS